MTANTANANQTSPVTGNICRWLCGDAAVRLLRGDMAPLYMRVETKAGPVETYYFVQQVRDEESTQCVGYRLHKEDANGKIVETHFVDITWGCTQPEAWVCDCKSARFGRSAKPCKHARGLAAALNRIGLLDVN